MFEAIRTTVSKKKNRYQKDGYNLDLTYITQNLIAMGYPAANVESIYRNNITDVANFLDFKHHNNYTIFHLCSEKNLDETRFTGKVKKFPFNDHQPPRFLQFFLLTKYARDYLITDQEKLNENKAIAINCKAGKGRTGVMICACLISLGIYCNPLEALNFYGLKRTTNGQGVTIPSQRRYVLYFGHLLTLPKTVKRVDTGQEEELFYRPLEIRITDIELFYEGSTASKRKHNQIPMKIIINNYQCKFESETSEELLTMTNLYKINSKNDENIGTSSIKFPVTKPISLAGDVNIQCKGNFKKLFEFSFNTFFVIYSCEIFKYAAKKKKPIPVEDASSHSTVNVPTMMNGTNRFFQHLSRQPSKIFSTTHGAANKDIPHREETLDENDSLKNLKQQNTLLITKINEIINNPSPGSDLQKFIQVDNVNKCKCQTNDLKLTKEDIEYHIGQLSKHVNTSISGVQLIEPHSHELIMVSRELDKFDHNTLPDLKVRILFSCTQPFCPLAKKLENESEARKEEPMQPEDSVHHATTEESCSDDESDQGITTTIF